VPGTRNFLNIHYFVSVGFENTLLCKGEDSVVDARLY
jgi:hypothetical protein